ncbi:expressed unknown protein [Seminavis robusta]|uniref:Macro domain-containing protein n=1 Tax=Seminavis robusta TaxID=568900 RepID=A0A9N8HD55_9STRA|nr:expressed unknown protein [Seminavis robusta]|eukprot:Sro410_g137340.1 n/a (1232) ;mRNA; f:12278-15973
MDELTRNRRHLARMESMLRNRTVAEKTRRRILSSRSLNGGSQHSIQEDEDNEEEDPRLTNQDQTTNTNGTTNTTNTTESEIHKNDSNVSNLSDSSRSAPISEKNACNGTTSATSASTAKGTNDNDVVKPQKKKKMKNPPQHVKTKFCAWAASFASLDPRIRIHRFFQEVAQEGDQKLAKDSRNQQPEKPTNEKSARELLASCFNMAQVFSVWRPCSKEAIRKMMAGHGVGKGLDIKGKSAKFGKCSAYVPFLQIHSERDKHKIEWLPQDARMTIFYATLETRNQALKVATSVRDEMVATVQSLDDSMLSQRDSITEAVRQAGMDNSSNSRLSLNNTNTNSEHQKSSLLQRRTSDDTPALKKKSEHSLLHRATSDGTAASIQQRRRSSDLERSSLQRGTSDGTAILSIRRRSSNMDDSATSHNARSSVSFEPVTVEEERRSLLQTSRTSSDNDVILYTAASQQKQKWEMTDPSIQTVDDYEKDGVYGMELPERLFWEAFVIREEEHCQRWRMLQKSKHGKNANSSRTTEDADESSESLHKQGYAELVMEQMLQVTETQSLEEPVIEWIDEANPIEDDSAKSLEEDDSSKQTSLAEEAPPPMPVKENPDRHNTSGTLSSFADMLPPPDFASTETLPSCNHTVRKGRRRPKTPSWSFVVCDRNRFEEQILRPIRQRDKTFQSNYDCFAGELRRSGFEEQTTGTGYSRWRHVYFQMDRPELCGLIGSEHVTGRESIVAYQDANFKSLRKSHKKEKGRPRVVLWSLPDDENPLCPHNLLMAYEEYGRVVPVVSDFDGFLVGTKRIHFETELEEYQVDLMKGNIKTAHEILEGNTSGSSWAAKWQYAGRDHLFAGASKRQGMPRFGYGDEKSYKLMEDAVTRLAELDGAVRHGAECFNFEYPQEMDPSFLVISDTIEGNVRWQYVDSSQLHYFLLKRIVNKFTFPLNPKWILCDPGWSKIYDKLLTSDIPNIQQSMNVWFPPKSGVRDMIAEIQEKHPTGLSFESSGNGVKTTRKASMGLSVVATYNLQSDTKDQQQPVQLFINRGSVVQFSRPGLRAGLVCATNECCVPVCGGVTQAVVEAGGRQLLRDAMSLPIITETSFGPVRCSTGDAQVVSRQDGSKYGSLDVSHVIWAAGPSYGESFSSVNDIALKDGLLRLAYQASLERAKEQGLESVGFSLISAGKRGSRWDPQRTLRIAMRAICDHREFGSVKEVHLCAFTANEVSALECIATEFELC